MSSIMKARIAYTGSALDNGEMGILNFTNALLRRLLGFLCGSNGRKIGKVG
ncbi:hypothetical protein [uncultured Megasphaera sp.]|uniref:hypothetical protein n=1 Tax=uncultured Megasphaera sp. TaxID=165188 RepID=UPI002594BC44|nr:hypothetical protein [uncultured Megasphaera sp.]